MTFSASFMCTPAWSIAQVITRALAKRRCFPYRRHSARELFEIPDFAAATIQSLFMEPRNSLHFLFSGTIFSALFSSSSSLFSAALLATCSRARRKSALTHSGKSSFSISMGMWCFRRRTRSSSAGADSVALWPDDASDKAESIGGEVCSKIASSSLLSVGWTRS